MKRAAIVLALLLLFGLGVIFADAEEGTPKFITITGITFPGAEGTYIGVSLHETMESHAIVFGFANYIMNGSLNVPLLSDDGLWHGTGDFFIVLGDYITKNKISIVQSETTIDFSEFIVITN